MKKKCSIKDGLSLTLLPKKSVSYAMQSVRFPLFDEAVLSSALTEGAEDLVVTFGDDRGLIVSNQQSIALLPFQGSVALETSNLVNPAYLASLVEPTVCEVVCRVFYRGEPVLSKSVYVTALPMTAFDPAMPKELVACFVRTGTQEQKKLLSEAVHILEKWKMPALFTGYERDKNRAYQQLAALATALRERNLVRSEGEGEFLFTDRNNELSVALWMAGCLEDARLHPLILLGEKIAVGVWLYEGCLPVSVTDDMSFVENYVAKGVNNLAFVNAEDLFDGVEGNFTIATKRFLSALSEGAFTYCVDIRRARIEGYRPMPVRRETANGFELVECAELDREARPETLSSFRYTFDATLPKEKRWERRLLDLTFRNPLLSFHAGRLAVPVLSSSLDETYFALSEKKSLKLTHTEEGMKKTLSDQRNLSRLVSLELENGTLRSPMGEAELSETLSRIVRRGKEADEESGGNLVYLAFGFLHFFANEKSDRKEIVSPLLLMPVRIGKSKGNLLPTIESAGEAPEVNTTLLEYLKQEYNIDVRGLDGNTEGLRIAEICAMIRMEVSGMKGWTVEESCYLSVFSFTRWFLWNDLRRNIDTFRLNPLVAAVYDGKPLVDQPVIEKKAREDYAPGEVITPLVADETQFEAVALSRTGTSFVLHGPPGTGKSQTITNMIANALKDGKRVLFVAEKEAALSVVKKRLDAIGVGDFCLELHSSRADKSAVVSHFERTLALAGRELPPIGDASRVGDVEGELRKGMESMHRVRRIGVSVYEGIVRALAAENAPDLVGIDSRFYDSLTGKKIEEYEDALLRLSFTANKCGGVHGIPFENVELSAFPPETRRALRFAAKSLLIETEQLKSFLALFADAYRQTISVVTEDKLASLQKVASILLQEDPVFTAGEERLLAFVRANSDLDKAYEYYFARFKKTVDIASEADELEAEIARWNDESMFKKPVRAVLRKLDRVRIAPVSHTEYRKVVETALIIHQRSAYLRTEPLAFPFVKRDGSFDLAKRDSELALLRLLEEKAGEAFLDYDQKTFLCMCCAFRDGSTRPVLFGLVHAIDAFRYALETFASVAVIDKTKVASDDVLGYYAKKATYLLSHEDDLALWCEYKKEAQSLRYQGLGFMVDALEGGKVRSDNIVACFEKHVFHNFLQTFLTGDPLLSSFSAEVTEEKVDLYRRLTDEDRRVRREELYCKLVSALPKEDETLGGETTTFARLAKTRGGSLRSLLQKLPALTAKVAPCMLMSPTTVASLLSPQPQFDLVIFDEASQMPTAEAIGCLARAKSAVVVGDPNQLPPTSFFASGYAEEDEEEQESVLDELISIGLPQRRLSWHYRSAHESLIAFSNARYYHSDLKTFPSPNGFDSKVSFRYVEDGVYDRGATKRNPIEAQALIDEVIARLSSPELSKKSMGIVTFSSVQKDYLDRLLSKAILSHHLEEVAYDREDPIFVKNLENVQGDERDVILFSVCYGPDAFGKVSLNFGPLNQAGGWRRLNVAVTRAREEMIVFSSLRPGMIDLSGTSARGVADLKAFLEFAERGKSEVAVTSGATAARGGIGRFLARELSAFGYECRADVGASSFKIDLAVVDPNRPDRYVLAVLADKKGPVYDAKVLQPFSLKRGDWNVATVYAESFYRSPRKVVRALKELLDRLTGRGNRRVNVLRSRQTYKYAVLPFVQREESYFLDGRNEREILSLLRKIVTREEPVSAAIVAKRLMDASGVYTDGVREKLFALLTASDFKREEIGSETWYRVSDRCLTSSCYRISEEGDPILTPYDVIAFLRCVLESRVALPKEELYRFACDGFRIEYNEASERFLDLCLAEGENRGIFLRSVSGRVLLN